MGAIASGTEPKRADSPRFAVLLRVHAFTKDLQSDWVKKILRIVSQDPLIARTYADDDEGITGCEFSGSQTLSPTEIGKWQKAQFKAAHEWLRSRSQRQFGQLREAGLKVDLCVAGYKAGVIPIEVVRELARLGLDLTIIGPP